MPWNLEIDGAGQYRCPRNQNIPGNRNMAKSKSFSCSREQKMAKNGLFSCSAWSQEQNKAKSALFSCSMKPVPGNRRWQKVVYFLVLTGHGNTIFHETCSQEQRYGKRQIIFLFQGNKMFHETCSWEQNIAKSGLFSCYGNRNMAKGRLFCCSICS